MNIIPTDYITLLEKIHDDLVDEITIHIKAFNSDICSYIRDNIDKSTEHINKKAHNTVPTKTTEKGLVKSEEVDLDKEEKHNHEEELVKSVEVELDKEAVQEDKVKTVQDESVKDPANDSDNINDTDSIKDKLNEQPHEKPNNIDVPNLKEESEPDILTNTSHEQTNKKGYPDKKPNNRTNKPAKNTVHLELYKIPALKFLTRNKIHKKVYKKLILKLHPDKLKEEDEPMLFKKYFNECKLYKKMNCVYKLCMLARKINLNITITARIHKAFINELNILKKYNDQLKTSIIYKWINEPLPSKKTIYINEYIQTNFTRN
tara:strand:+ start:6317 stop:7270 length:954 start_codon:yes stop_codon:yes gene_type:complete